MSSSVSAGRRARRRPARRSCRRPGAPAGRPRCRTGSRAAPPTHERARSQSTLTPMSSTVSRWNSGRSASGRPSSAAITATGNGNRSWLTRSAWSSSMNSSIMPCTSGGDQLVLPAIHRLAGERLLQDRAVGVVLRRVHLEDGMAEHHAHHLGVAGRAEVAVAEDRVDGVIGVGGVELQPSGTSVICSMLAPSRWIGPERAGLDVPGIGRGVAVGAHGPVELLERIVARGAGPCCLRNWHTAVPLLLCTGRGRLYRSG